MADKIREEADSLFLYPRLHSFNYKTEKPFEGWVLSREEIQCQLFLKDSFLATTLRINWRWGEKEGKRRETSRPVRRLLQLIIHARNNGDLDQSDGGGSVKNGY